MTKVNISEEAVCGKNPNWDAYFKYLHTHVQAQRIKLNDICISHMSSWNIQMGYTVEMTHIKSGILSYSE